MAVVASSAFLASLSIVLCNRNVIYQESSSQKLKFLYVTFLAGVKECRDWAISILRVIL